MRIGIVGGTGKQGVGLALRWSKRGHEIAIGSRDPEKARAHAESLLGRGFVGITGGDNSWCVQQSELVVLSVPYEAHRSTLEAIKAAVGERIVVDMTVPLKPPKVNRVHLPEGRAAALETQAVLGSTVPVIAMLHHVSSTHLADLEHSFECDVLVAGDVADVKKVCMGLVGELGLRALDAGPLENAIALESLTPVLIHLNKTYKSKGAGLVFTNLPT